MNVEAVNKPEYEGRCRIVDERFDRGKERIEDLEEVSRQMVTLNTQFAEIIKSDHERMTCICDDVSDLKIVSTQLNDVVQELKKNDEDREKRLRKIESKPGDKYYKIAGWIGSAFIGAVIVYLFNIFVR